jgi:hypothetical protein
MDDSTLIYMRYWHSSSSAVSKFGTSSVSNPMRVSRYGVVYGSPNRNGRAYGRPQIRSTMFHTRVSAAGGWSKSASRRGRPELTVADMNRNMRILEEMTRNSLVSRRTVMEYFGLEYDDAPR